MPKHKPTSSNDVLFVLRIRAGQAEAYERLISDYNLGLSLLSGVMQNLVSSPSKEQATVIQQSLAHARTLMLPFAETSALTLAPWCRLDTTTTRTKEL